MSKLTWDSAGTRWYEAGNKYGVLYPMKDDGTYDTGVAWNGLVSVTLSPDGAEPNELWADNMKYAVLRSAETLGLSIEAYTYPDEFNACNGAVEAATGVYVHQQKRKAFGFCFRTEIGSDTTSTGDNYKLHIVYGCTAQPADEDFETINDSPDAITFSWDIDTLPVVVDGFEPTSEIVIDSRVADATKLAALEAKLYGDATNDPTLPPPSEVISTMTAA